MIGSVIYGTGAIANSHFFTVNGATFSAVRTPWGWVALILGSTPVLSG